MNNNPKCFCGRDAWRPVDGEKHYCIFHSPKIEEKKEEFKHYWEKYLSDKTDDNNNIVDLDCEGFIFPINISFSNKILSGFTNFTSAKFYKNIIFSISTIKDEIDFSNAHFFGHISFTYISCSCSVDFSNTTFSHKAYFSSSLFEIRGLFASANYTGTNLTNSSFTNCSFENVKYNLKPIKWKKPEKCWQLWNYQKLEKPIPPIDFTGIETSGILAASNRQFVRDIQDQQFLKQFEKRHPVWYKIWLYTCDCGRSFKRFFFVCFLFAFLFGVFYACAGEKWFENAYEWNWITPFYYSLVTFSTLGFCDVTPKLSNTCAQFTVMLEVFLGYIGLGGLISIFANKLARRA